MIKSSFFKSTIVSFVLGLGLSLAIGQVGYSQTAENAPPELQTLLQEIETASNNHNLNQVLNFYSADFTNSDNLNKSIFQESLRQLWSRFPNLNYRTELLWWERNGDQLVAQTVTFIEGSQRIRNNTFSINSTIQSRQYLENNQIVRQEILAEKTQLRSGENPPDVTVRLPERVNRGERFSFDVIVEQPLGNDILLGAVIEERTNSNLYLNPSSFDLEVLAAGGIFKWVKAPLVADQRWLSALLVHGDGMTLITQRVIIE